MRARLARGDFRFRKFVSDPTAIIYAFAHDDGDIRLGACGMAEQRHTYTGTATELTRRTAAGRNT